MTEENQLTIDVQEIPLFDQICAAYHDELKAEADWLKKVMEAKDTLDVTGLKIEMAVIHAAGSEKSVGATEAARNRTFSLAKADNPAYKAAKAQHFDAKHNYRYHQGMVRLFEIRLKFLVPTANNSFIR